MRQFINENEFLSITVHTGKMEGIPSLSTNKFLNKNCMRLTNSKSKNAICKKCYVDRVTNQYKTLEPSLTNNTNILRERLLTQQEINEFTKAIINNVLFRFESFGDLNNETQLINYINIAKACKYTKFALFTKHFGIVLNYFRKGLKMPKNITLVLSSREEEKPLKSFFVEIFKKYHSRVISFTVTKDKDNKSINCGKRKCIECRNCYDSKNPHNVLELEK